MNLPEVMDFMEMNSRRVAAAVKGLPLETARWKPDAENWSILEVMGHLYDEEREDFRVRLDIILHRPGQPWPPIDPTGWVIERRYNERDLEATLQGFLDERQTSLRWLHSLKAPNWEAAEQAPWGTVKAGDMLAAWAAHDLLHLRQLNELHRAWLLTRVIPYRTQYAGDW